MSPYLGEFLGTFLLILMGGSVNANLDLAKTKGSGSGWLLMSWGWGMSVFLGVYTALELGGSGHINPAISIGMAAFGKLDSTLLLGYVFAQMAGAFCGAVVTWAAFRMHFEATAIRHTFSNFLTELIGTFVLAFGALAASAPTNSLGALDALPVALLVAGIGMGLGGPTGYAINPARDLGPRIAHFVLPISGKRDSDWSYSWIPVIGPITGALLGVGLYSLL
jgi:glycerol uptake facilitator protein